MGVKINIGLVFIASVIMLELVTTLAASPEGGFNRQKISCGNGSSHPMALRYLGAVNGKGYFVEANMSMNWAAAHIYCNSSSLELASIDTQLEADFINQTLVPYGREKVYWTSLHETEITPSLMEWDGNRKEPNTTLFNWTLSVTTRKYCGALGFQPPHIEIDVTDCSLSRRVICQSDFTKFECI